MDVVGRFMGEAKNLSFPDAEMVKVFSGYVKENPDDMANIVKMAEILFAYRPCAFDDPRLRQIRSKYPVDKAAEEERRRLGGILPPPSYPKTVLSSK
jgi:hypothetical protein